MTGDPGTEFVMGGALVVSDRSLLPPVPGGPLPDAGSHAAALPVVQVTHEVVPVLPDAPEFDGTPAFHPTDEGWCCVVPGVATLRITALVPRDAGRVDAVVVHELAGADPALVDHLVVDHAIPRLLAARGALVLHATCVTAGARTGEDVAVAFLGPTGAGKSTLAAALLGRGSALVADDCLAVHVEATAVTALPSVPYTRLLPDAAARLGAAVERAGRGADTGARRAGKHVAGAVAAPGPTTLAAAFVLARDPVPARTGAVAIERVPPAAAVWELASQSFNAMLLGTPPSAVALRSLVGGVRPIAERLPVLRLRYGSGYDGLDAVLDGVLATVRAVLQPPVVGMPY